MLTDFRVYTPLLSLVDEDYSPQHTLIEAHLNWLKREGTHGLLVMGTTGEFPNFSVSQRQRYLEAVMQHNPGLDVMVNIGAASVEDILALQRHAVSVPGVRSILWMPPFYFPDTEINGLDAMLTRILTHQPAEIPFYLYHYPRMSQVHITPELLERFDRVAGLKDTSGDFDRIGQLVRQFPQKQVFVGTDYQITLSRQLGAAGIISSLSNLFPKLFTQAIQGDMVSEEALKQLRSVFNPFPKIPAMKAYFNHLALAPQRTHATLPFQDLNETEAQQVVQSIESVLTGAYAHAD